MIVCDTEVVGTKFVNYAPDKLMQFEPFGLCLYAFDTRDESSTSKPSFLPRNLVKTVAENKTKLTCDVETSTHDDDSSQSNPNDEDVVDLVLNDEDQDPNQKDDGDAAQACDEGNIYIDQNEQFTDFFETIIPTNNDEIDTDLSMKIGQWSLQPRQHRRMHKLNSTTTFHGVLVEEHAAINDHEEDAHSEEFDAPVTE